MKLLSKADIDAQKAQERSVEVDEGVKLAKRVDGLRKLAAQEEANLRKFRDESVAEVKKEILKLTEDVAALRNEVSDLETRRKAALKPLTQREQVIVKKETELNDRSETLAQGAAVLSQGHGLLEEAKKEVKKDEERVQERLSSADDVLADAELKRRDAEAALKNAQTIEDNARTTAREMLRDITVREENVAARERDAEMVRERQEKESIALTERERRINDKYQTLLRTEKRHG